MNSRARILSTAQYIDKIQGAKIDMSGTWRKPRKNGYDFGKKNFVNSSFESFSPSSLIRTDFA